MRKIGRNELCPCGSGKKYKKCCLEKDMKITEKNKNDFCSMTIEDAEKCREYYRLHPDADHEFAEQFRITPDPVAVDRCRRVCENFDTCLLVLAEPNDPPECIDFYNEDMYKQFYDSKDEILEHIKAFGFVPNITSETNELLGEEDEDKGNISILDIDLCLKDGDPLFTRLYEKWGDKPWEFISQDCPRIGIGGSREVMKEAMRYEIE